MVPLEQAIDDSDVRFYQAQQRARWFNIAASVVVAALLAWALSRALLRRLQVLTGGIHQLAAGDYTTRIANKTDDEHGRVGPDLKRRDGKRGGEGKGAAVGYDQGRPRPTKKKKK